MYLLKRLYEDPPFVSSREKQTKLQEIAFAAMVLLFLFCDVLSSSSSFITSVRTISFRWFRLDNFCAARSNSFSTEDERKAFHPGDWSWKKWPVVAKSESFLLHMYICLYVKRGSSAMRGGISWDEDEGAQFRVSYRINYYYAIIRKYGQINCSIKFLNKK